MTDIADHPAPIRLRRRRVKDQSRRPSQRNIAALAAAIALPLATILAFCWVTVAASQDLSPAAAKAFATIQAQLANNAVNPVSGERAPVIVSTVSKNIQGLSLADQQAVLAAVTTSFQSKNGVIVSYAESAAVNDLQASISAQVQLAQLTPAQQQAEFDAVETNLLEHTDAAYVPSSDPLRAQALDAAVAFAVKQSAGNSKDGGLIAFTATQIASLKAEQLSQHLADYLRSASLSGVPASEILVQVQALEAKSGLSAKAAASALSTASWSLSGDLTFSRNVDAIQAVGVALKGGTAADITPAGRAAIVNNLKDLGQREAAADIGRQLSIASSNNPSTSFAVILANLNLSTEQLANPFIKSQIAQSQLSIDQAKLARVLRAEPGLSADAALEKAGLQADAASNPQIAKMLNAQFVQTHSQYVTQKIATALRASPDSSLADLVQQAGLSQDMQDPAYANVITSEFRNERTWRDEAKVSAALAANPDLTVAEAVQVAGIAADFSDPQFPGLRNTVEQNFNLQQNYARQRLANEDADRLANFVAANPPMTLAEATAAAGLSEADLSRSYVLARIQATWETDTIARLTNYLADHPDAQLADAEAATGIDKALAEDPGLSAKLSSEFSDATKGQLAQPTSLALQQALKLEISQFNAGSGTGFSGGGGGGYTGNP